MGDKVVFPDVMTTLQTKQFHFRVTEPGWTFPKHHHKMFELLYCYDGSAIQTVDEKPIPFHSGNWLIIPPGIRHSVMNPGPGNYAYLSLTFDVDDPQFRHWFQVQPVQTWNNDQLSQSALAQLDALLTNTLLLSSSSAPVTNETEQIILMMEKFRLQAVLFMVLHEILNLQLATSSPRQITNKDLSLYELEIAYQIEKYISKNYHSADLTISRIAEQFCLSRVQCHKIFTKVHNISPRQYLTNKRLQQAKYLLLHSNLKIQAIAEQVGFHSVSHFSRHFKRWTGVSPMQYRPKIFN